MEAYGVRRSLDKGRKSLPTSVRLCRPTDYRPDPLELDSKEATFVRRLRREQKLRMTRMQQALQESRERAAQEEVQSVQRVAEQQKEKKAARLQEVKRRLEGLAARRLSREQAKLHSDESLKKLKHTKARFMEIEERFQSLVESPIREQERAVLQKRRELRTPMDLEALQTHAKSFDSLLQQRTTVQRSSVDMRRKGIHRLRRKLSILKTRTASVIEEEEKQRLLAEAEKAEQPRIRMKRKQQYGFLVSLLFVNAPKPKSSHKGISIKARSHSEAKLRISGRTEVRGRRPLFGLQKKRSESERTLPQPDYLREKRLKAEANFANCYLAKGESRLEEILTDSSLSSPERIVEVQKEAQRLDMKAQRHEALLDRMGIGWDKSLQATEAVSDLYLSSIRAKLALINAIE